MNNEEKETKETEKKESKNGTKVAVAFIAGFAVSTVLNRKMYQKGFEKGIKLIVKNLK